MINVRVDIAILIDEQLERLGGLRVHFGDIFSCLPIPLPAAHDLIPVRGFGATDQFGN